MQYDLLEARATLDWTESNLDDFRRRLEAWMDANIVLEFKEVPANDADYLIVAEERDPFPLTFSAEAGAYINSIRSSLDILACSLARRIGMTNENDLVQVQFPIAASEEKFIKRKFKGAEFFNSLSERERDIIVDLKPYVGGNKELSALHTLDITRKHRRLLAVGTSPASFQINGPDIQKNFKRLSTGWAVNPGETYLGFISKEHKPKYRFAFSPYVGLNDPGIYPQAEIVWLLRTLRDLAADIVTRFDF